MNKITTQIKPEFTPGWSAVLDALVDINSPVATPPSVSLENSWEYVIVRLLKVQQNRGYKNGWVVYQVLEAGNPPIEYWVWMSKRFGYNSTWPAKIRSKRPETAFPDIDAITFGTVGLNDFEYWEKERSEKSFNMFDLLGKT